MTKAPETLRFLGVLAIAGFLAWPRGASSIPGADFAAAARQNQESLDQLAFAPFRRQERGWAVYEPLVAHEIEAKADASTPTFAHRLAAWQTAHGLRPTGVMDEMTFAAMEAVWQGRRPFVAASRRVCPPPPPEASLATAPAQESYGGKVLRLRPAALAAFGELRAAALAETPALRSDPRLLTLFSAYRSPESDAARCARDGNCQGIVRASCSAHLTGLAVDINLGAAPGFPPDSSDDANRLYVTRGAAYRWMVDNAARFGFEPYPFEPWHWEWTGEPI